MIFSRSHHCLHRKFRSTNPHPAGSCGLWLSIGDKADIPSTINTANGLRLHERIGSIVKDLGQLW